MGLLERAWLVVVDTSLSIPAESVGFGKSLSQGRVSCVQLRPSQPMS